jgi:uncharacterized membrane protein
MPALTLSGSILAAIRACVLVVFAISFVIRVWKKLVSL